jgi:microcystin-dependent protein
LSNYIIGERGGVENVTVTTGQLPMHTHGLLANPAAATLNNANNGVFAGSGQNKVYSDVAPANAMNAGMVSSVGGNQPHNNQQPFLVCNWIIAQYGIYPTQS